MFIGEKLEVYKEIELGLRKSGLNIAADAVVRMKEEVVEENNKECSFILNQRMQQKN